MLQTLLHTLFPVVSTAGPSIDDVISSIAASPRTIQAAALRARGITSLDSVTAAVSYDDSDLLRSAVHKMKYGGIRSLALPLGTLVGKALSHLSLGDGVALCPVPLHWTRRFARGFNQSALLADVALHTSGLPVVHCLRRTRPTGHQVRRTRSERFAAMTNAFAVRCDVSSHVVLVDDIATTCATLDACACALKSAGVKRVDAVVIALA